MTTAATSLLGLALPVTGELSGTWGDTVNNSITALLDSAVAGTTTLSADVDVTLTTTALAANQAREAIILWTAAGTVTRYITAPAQSKIYAVLNKSSTQSIVLRGVGPTTGVTILAGKQAMVAWDGTDYVEISSGYVDGPATSTDNAVARFDGTDGKLLQNSVVIIADTTGNMTGVGTLSSGAITSSALTATRVLFAGTSGLIQDDADLTFNGTILTSTGFAGPLNGTVGATTPAAGSFTNITGSANAVISVTDNTNAALRITQLGTGNALLVEDSANPDATPFVVNNAGQVIVGDTSTYTSGGVTASLQVTGTTADTGAIAINSFRNSANGAFLSFAHSKSGVNGTQTTLVQNDAVGLIRFSGSDGTAFIQAAAIEAFVDGTPGTNDMPGRLTFSTTADGASSPTERMRINSAGSVGIGGSAVASVTLNLARNITGATTSSALQQVGEVQSDVTTLSNGYLSTLVTQATAFTLGQQRHFSATQGTIGASSAVTNQYGFYADITLTGATNNYGFYSNIAAGTNRFNFYAANTATNFFAGNTIISVTDNTNAALRITQLGTGNALLVEDEANPDATPFVINSSGSVIQGATTLPTGLVGPAMAMVGSTAFGPQFLLSNKVADTSAAYVLFRKDRAGVIVNSGDSVGNVQFSGFDGTSYVSAASIIASVDGTPGTNDMPGRLVFSTTADGASSPTERMRIDSSGDVGIGTTAPVVKLEIAGNNNTIWTVTASISGVTMDVTAVSSGTIAVGDLVFGINIQPYTRVTALGTGTGGVGTYTVSVFQTAASATTIGTTQYGATLIRITDTDTNQAAGQPNGALQFFTSDSTAPTAGVGAYVAALAESTSPDTSLVFGTRNKAGGGVDANERMRLDSSGNLGIGTNLPGAKLDVVGTAAISGAVTLSGGTANGVTYLNGSKVLTSGTALTFDGTNLGVGRSPLLSLDVQSAVGAIARLRSGATYGSGFFGTLPNSDTSMFALSDKANTTGGTAGQEVALYTNSLPLVFQIGTEKMRLDSSGNLGLGVTPSAWGTNQRALQLNIGSGATGAFVADTSGNVVVSQNSYFNTSWKYQKAGTASIAVSLAGGGFSWNTAPSGTADAAITFTQAMTLDSSGNLGIGTTSPGGNSVNRVVKAYGSTSSSVQAQSSATTISLGAGGGEGYVEVAGAYPLEFIVNSTERARIDSSGNLLVGTTTLSGSAGTRMSLAKGGTIWQTGPATANSGNTFYVINSSDVGVSLASGSTAWIANSDERLKTALTPFVNAAEKVSTLRAGTGRYLTDAEGVSRSFLIAQDVQKILPEAVDIQNDEQGTLGLRYTELIPLLTAAIQEQQALIVSLTQRLTALESK